MASFPLPHFGQVALITGSASGIGEACARELFALGASVVMTDMNIERGRAIAMELNASIAKGLEGETVEAEAEAEVGGRRKRRVATFRQSDLSKGEETKALAAHVLKRFGKVDILVNNAGLQHVSSLESFPEHQWRQMQEIMLTAPFLLTQAVLPSMYAQNWGRIINVGSINSVIGSPYKAAYVAAKHGVLGLTRVTALEAGVYGVTCNCLCPSYVNTPLVEAQIKPLAETHEIAEEVVPKIIAPGSAVKRLLESWEVAKLVAFLCGEAAGGITGSVQNIDCGWMAH